MNNGFALEWVKREAIVHYTLFIPYVYSKIMLLHSVYFWLSNPESSDDRAALKAGLESLRGISDIQTAYIGSPAETRRPVIDHSYDLSLIVIFADKAAHDVYQDHPVHLEFVAECKHLWNQAKIYDVDTA